MEDVQRAVKDRLFFDKMNPGEPAGSLPRMRLKLSDHAFEPRWVPTEDLRDAVRMQQSPAKLIAELKDWSTISSPPQNQAARLKKQREPTGDWLKITIRDICAHGLPNADEDDGSDPYCVFTLLECRGKLPPPSATTQTLEDTLDPEWSDVLEIVVPPTCKGSVTREPIISVRVIDADAELPPPPPPPPQSLAPGATPVVPSTPAATPAAAPPSAADHDGVDDPLGEVELQLSGGSGSFERVSMWGSGLFGGQKQDWQSFVSFSYEVEDYTPPPSNILLLHDFRLETPPAILGADPTQEPKKPSGLYLKFAIADLPYLKPVQTPIAPSTTSTFTCWDGCELNLSLQQLDVPTLRVALCSDEVSLSHPCATGSVRLGAGDPEYDATHPSAESEAMTELVLKGRHNFPDLQLKLRHQVIKPSQQ